MAKKTNRNILFAMCVFLLVAACTAAGQTIFVDADAAGSNDGSSWSNAYIYLQDALAYAESNGDINEIRVAQGIYKPDQGIDQTPGDREATFQLVNGITLKGGYAGLGETDPDERDIDIYETVLSGDLNGDDGEIAVSDLLTDPNRADNSYHVVNGSGTDSSATFNGFTITKGNANNANPNDRGGGIYIDNGSPTITNITVTKNSAGNNLDDAIQVGGGGMYVSWGSPASTLTGCTFRENLYFIDSPVSGGGGLYSKANIIVDNCFFIGNWTWTYNNHGNSNGGGGIFLDGTSVLNNCTFIDNYSSIHAGAIWTRGTFTLTNSTFIGNYASSSGGVMHIDQSDGLVANCLFFENAASRGGVVSQYNYKYVGSNFGGCTFSGNSASVSSGAIRTVVGGKVILTNCILWGDTPDEINGTVTAKYSDIQGGWLGDDNIDADPLFVDPCNGDYHLSPASPCIDAGDNTAVPPDTADLDGDGNTTEPIPFDLDGNPRFVDCPDIPDTGNGTPPIVDMGAYEAIMLAVQVVIDIKPGSYPNAINLGSHGLIPVAIFSSEDFDATTVDPDTVELAGSSIEVKVKGKSNKYMAHEDDVDGDGLIDLVVHVATANLDPDSLQDGWAVLTGTTYDRQDIEGQDEITIVPPEN